jgi:hypothetical protein
MLLWELLPQAAIDRTVINAAKAEHRRTQEKRRNTDSPQYDLKHA